MNNQHNSLTTITISGLILLCIYQSISMYAELNRYYILYKLQNNMCCFIEFSENLSKYESIKYHVDIQSVVIAFVLIIVKILKNYINKKK